MAQKLMGSSENESVPLFNSTLETGVRSVVVLDAVYPRAFDLTRITWLDHLVVHTADIGGPKSLHPAVPQRTGELLVRRRLVDEGISLMRRLHLIDADVTDLGVMFRARDDEASAFVDSLRTSYGRGLKERARWLATFLAERSDEAIADLVADRIGRWTVEFQSESDSRRPSP